MKNSQYIRRAQYEKGFVVPLLIIIVAVLMIGGGVYYYSKNIKPTGPTSYKNEAIVNAYNVLADESLWRNKYVSTNIPVEWNVPSKNIVIKKIQENSFSCGEKQANFVNYTSYNAGSNYVGGWNSVSVIDCGTYYFVYENGDAGPKLYGPFDLNISTGKTTTKNPPVTNNQAPILKVNGPQELNLNQLGTWTVNAYSPNDKGEGSTLTYSEKWGDSNTIYTQYPPFTHAYSQFGTYTLVFTAKDSTGAQTITSTSVRVMNTTSPGLNATSNWKTYTSSQYGFEVKYPKDYYLTENKTGISIESSQTCKTIRAAASGPWPKDCLIYDLLIQKDKILVEGTGVIKTTTQVAGYSAERIEDNNQGMWDGMIQTTIQFNKDNQWYINRVSFNLETKTVAESMLEQIVSTFKFTN